MLVSCEEEIGYMAATSTKVFFLLKAVLTILAGK